MSRKNLLLTAFFLLVLLPVAAPAQTELLLKDSQSVEGKIVSTTDHSITLKYDKDGVSRTVEYQVDALDPVSYFTLRSADLPKLDQAADHLALGKFCIEHELWPQARRQLDRAIHIDPSLDSEEVTGLLKKARHGIAMTLMERARREYGNGDLNAAQSHVKAVLRMLADSPDAPNAAALLKKIDDKIHVSHPAYAKPNTNSAEGSKETKRIQELLTRGEQYDRKALSEKSQSQQLHGYSQAIAYFSKAVSDIKALAKKHAQDADFQAQLKSLEDKAVSEAIETYINEGSVYMTRGSYNDALRVANSALAIDPDNEQAKSFRSQVENGSAMSSRRFGRGGMR